MRLGSSSDTFKCHNFFNGEVVHHYQPGTKVEGPIRSISWSRDGTLLALVPWSGKTELLSVKENLKLLKTINDVEEPTCVCFPNTTKKSVCLGSKNGLVLFYELKSRNISKRFETHHNKITHLEYTAKDTNIVAGCENGEVFVFSNVTNSPPSLLKIPKSRSITCLNTNFTKRNLVLGGSNEGIVVLWDINVGRPKFYLEAHVAAVNAVAFSPTSHALAITTGSDRHFNFIDINDRTKITSIQVENNLTAIDFLHDGYTCVMASQKGVIHVYDLRKLQAPVRSFAAHKKSIKHLMFQKSSDSGDSLSNLSNESFTSVTEKLEVKHQRNSDLFGLFAPTADSPGGKRQSVASTDGGDSFLAALGLDKSSPVVSACYDDEVFSRDNNRLPTILSSSAEETNKTANEQKAPLEKFSSLETYSSTPILCSQLSQPSAFQYSENLKNNNNLENQKSLPADWETKLSAVKDELTHQIMQSAYQLRTMILGVQMAIVRESIQTEDNFKKFRSILNDPVNTSEVKILMEENEMLRLRIQFLEEQLKNLTSRKDDDKSS